MSRHHIKLNARQWARAEKMAKDRTGWKCERCGKRGKLEVHHTKRLHDGGDPYDPDNLEVLCRSCHIAHHRPDDMLPGRAEWKKFVEELEKVCCRG